MTIVIRGSPFEAIYGFGDALWHVHADVHGIPCPNRHCWGTSAQNARSAGEETRHGETRLGHPRLTPDLTASPTRRGSVADAEHFSMAICLARTAGLITSNSRRGIR